MASALEGEVCLTQITGYNVNGSQVCSGPREFCPEQSQASLNLFMSQTGFDG